MHFCNFWTFFCPEESKHIQARCCAGRDVFLENLVWGLKKLFCKIVALSCYSIIGQTQTKVLSPFVILSHYIGGREGSSTKDFWGSKELFLKITVLSSFSMEDQIFKLCSRKCFCDFQIILFRFVKNICFGSLQSYTAL